jgi:hypothetical protein
MRSIKNKISALEKRVGFENIEVDPQHTYLERERLELISAFSEAHRTGTEQDIQALREKLADNAKALEPYGNYPYRPCSVESLVEALERARNDKRR